MGHDLDREVRRGLIYALEGRLAPHYERHLVQDCHYRTPQVLAEALAGVAPVRGQWLDLGAGPGLVGKAIVDRALALEFVAIDISETMLALIDCPAYVSRCVADCTGRLPFPDGSFDGAVAAGLLEHIVSPGRVFAEVARLLRPRTHFVFSFPPNWSGRTELLDAEQGLLSHDADSIRQCLDACGLRIAFEGDYPAYVNGSKGWLTHRLVVSHCAS